MSRILVAEDDPAIRIPMARFLRRQMHEVVEVYHPVHAQQALRESKEEGERLDLIVLDLIMPANNPNGGREVLEFMRDENIETPVILATAYGYNGPADRARRDFPTVKDVLTKTFPLEELQSLIEQVVGNRSEEDEKQAEELACAGV